MKNLTILTGHLGSDPEENGKAVKLSLAEDVFKFDDREEKFIKINTRWFPITLFNKLAADAKSNLKKGDHIQVSGILNTSSYQTKSGETRRGFEVIAKDLKRISSINNSSFRSEGPTAQNPSNTERHRHYQS